MHQIVVTILCHLCAHFPEGEFAVFRYRENALFLWEVLLFLQNPLYVCVCVSTVPRESFKVIFYLAGYFYF